MLEQTRHSHPITLSGLTDRRPLIILLARRRPQDERPRTDFFPNGNTSDVLPLPVETRLAKRTEAPNVTTTPSFFAVLCSQNEHNRLERVHCCVRPLRYTDNWMQYKLDKLTWTVSGDGSYIVVTVYGRGTGQVQNMQDIDTNGLRLTDADVLISWTISLWLGYASKYGWL
ncbi:hypothetical protein BDW66DRAFT_72674 [Aspergillus desertorum]